MSSVSLWSERNPFADFDTVVRRAFDTPARSWSGSRPTGFVPAADVVREGDDAVVRLELPGVDVEKDVTVEVDGSRLVVRGERRDARTEEHGGRSLREVRYGSFRRSFALPTHVTADAVSASYDAGVLSVRVAGIHAGGGARRIAVTTGAPAGTAVEGDGEQSGERAAA
jgi:HSP20 family protein